MKHPKAAISLMTFNIAHGRGLSLYQGFHSPRSISRNLDRIAAIIREQQPDIVALQEIDESSHWNGHINLLDYLQSATGYDVAIHGVHNRRDGRKPLAYGNAFLSKHKARRWQVVPFGTRSLGEKGFLEASFEVDGSEIDLINLHLDFRSRSARIRQVEQLLASVHQRSIEDPYHLPPIICGDFNTGSASSRDALQHIIQRRASVEAYQFYPTAARTFPAHFPSRGLDFFLLAEPYEAVSAETLRCYASDHLPVFAEVSYPKDWRRQLPQESSAGLNAP